MKDEKKKDRKIYQELNKRLRLEREKRKRG